MIAEKPEFYSIERDKSGLERVLLSTPLCTAEIYLQGAHVTRFQPAGGEPLLFLSERSNFSSGKAIRGGIPVIFPWFGPRTANSVSDRTDGPAHGFARTSLWHLDSATMDGDIAVVTFTLGPDENSRALGYDHFLVTYTQRFGKLLELIFSVENSGASPLAFEEALHTYFNIGEITEVMVTGLQNTEYLDKTDAYKRKREVEPALRLVQETDRPYLNTKAPVTINDPVLNRQIKIEKANSDSTVVWNPWQALTAKLADMEPDSWHKMICVESGNVSENSIVLNAGESHRMQVKISC